jgi:hypothetical protein
MMRRYEKACQEMKGREMESVTGDVVSILEELPRVVRENSGGVASLLSRLSSCLREETLSPVRALKLVDHILSAIGKTLVTEWENKDHGYRWVGDLLAVLSSHTSLHSPLYARLNELLTSQFVELVAMQLFAVAVLLCQAFHAAPPMAGLELNGTALCTGKEFCLDLLCQLRHDMPTQALRFCCIFMEQFIHIERETPLPTCVLRKMVYMYKRARFLHSTFTENTVLEAVERLLLENHYIAEQWHSCKISFEAWVSWELDVREERTARPMRLSYRWKEIYGTYLLSSSADQLFQTLFKALVRQQHSAEFVAILQELARVGCSSSSPLLETLQTLLSDVSN